MGGRTFAHRLEACARSVGVVTQRTELLAAYAPRQRHPVRRGAARPGRGGLRRARARRVGRRAAAGLDTLLGAGGVTPVGRRGAARRLRPAARPRRARRGARRGDRTDGPETERRVVPRPPSRLLAGRTGVVVAHRLPRPSAATRSRSSRTDGWCSTGPRRSRWPGARAVPRPALRRRRGAARHRCAGAADPQRPPARPAPGADPDAAEPSLAACSPARHAPPLGPARRARVRRCHAVGVYGAFTGWLWGRLVADLQAATTPWSAAALLAVAC